jgi:GNAT superfamily N-acetyltransferase
MTDDELAGRVHRSLMEVSSWMDDHPGGAAEYRDGELLYASASPLPFLNGVMRDGPRGDATALIERARRFFFARDRGFLVYCHPGDPELERAARELGLFEVMSRYPEMICRTPLEALPGDVRQVQDVEAAAAYWRICDEAYPSIGMPPGVFTASFPAESLLEAEHGVACLGHDVEGNPVACASLWLAGGVGMVGWVGALPAARGLGLAAACTVWATNQAFALGADVASLQASEMGEPIYARLGYEELFAYRLLGEMPRA